MVHEPWWDRLRRTLWERPRYGAPAPQKIEWESVVLEQTYFPVGVTYGVMLTCSLCGRRRPALAATGLMQYSMSYGRYLAWEFPAGWSRVEVNGKRSLVCHDHECLAPRPT